MISKTDICNLALTYLGQKTISNITDTSVSAIKCNLLYDIARDATLRSHPWNFATRVTTLAEISDETIIGWDYLYYYPSNALYIRKVFSDESTSYVEPTEYKEVISPDTNVRAIASDQTPAYCEYIEKITDTSLYDSSFIAALAYRLAFELAQPLTGDDGLRGAMFNSFQIALDQAKLYNASENNEKKRSSNSYVDAR